MRYSDLKQEEVDKLIDEINATKLTTDLILMEIRMRKNGKIYNDAYDYLKEEIERRNAKSRGGRQ